MYGFYGSCQLNCAAPNVLPGTPPSKQAVRTQHVKSQHCLLSQKEEEVTQKRSKKLASKRHVATLQRPSVLNDLWLSRQELHEHFFGTLAGKSFRSRLVLQVGRAVVDLVLHDKPARSFVVMLLHLHCRDILIHSPRTRDYLAKAACRASRALSPASLKRMPLVSQSAEDLTHLPASLDVPVNQWLLKIDRLVASAGHNRTMW